MKTIKQIADEIGVSKTAVRNRIENLGLSDKMQTNGNRIEVNEGQERLIKSTFLQNKPQTKIANKVFEKTETFQLVSDLVSTLKEQLQEKDRQIHDKDKQIQEKDKQLEQQHQSIKELTAALENTTNSLKAAQALHAGTMQQNILTKSIDEIREQTEPAEASGVHKKWYEFWK